MVTGSPGGRTIINTVLHTILNVIDFGMNARTPSTRRVSTTSGCRTGCSFERNGLSPDTLAILKGYGHTLNPIGAQGIAEAIVVSARDGKLNAGATTGGRWMAGRRGIRDSQDSEFRRQNSEDRRQRATGGRSRSKPCEHGNHGRSTNASQGPRTWWGDEVGPRLPPTAPWRCVCPPCRAVCAVTCRRARQETEDQKL